MTRDRQPHPPPRGGAGVQPGLLDDPADFDAASGTTRPSGEWQPPPVPAGAGPPGGAVVAAARPRRRSRVRVALAVLAALVLALIALGGVVFVQRDEPADDPPATGDDDSPADSPALDEAEAPVDEGKVG